MFVELFTGVFAAILRVLMALGALFVAMLRVDRSLFPKWIDDLIVLDAMAKAFRSLVVMYHHHNNPSVHVFLRLIAEEAAQRKAEARAARRAKMKALMSRSRQLSAERHDGMFTCSKCFYVCGTEAALQNHVSAHRLEEPRVCAPLCVAQPPRLPPTEHCSAWV